MQVSREVKGVGDHQFPTMEAGRLDEGQWPDPLHHCIGLWCHLQPKCKIAMFWELSWSNKFISPWSWLKQTLPLLCWTSMHQGLGCGQCGSADYGGSGRKRRSGLENCGWGRYSGHWPVRWSNHSTSDPEIFLSKQLLKSFINCDIVWLIKAKMRISKISDYKMKVWRKFCEY